MIIACDADGTLWDEPPWNCLELMYNPNFELIAWLIGRRKVGDKLILWTCREDLASGLRYLTMAVDFCKELGLEFDAVNENIQPNNYRWQPRKIYYDILIDDRAVEMIDIGIKGIKIQEILEDDLHNYHFNKWLEEKENE